MKNVDTIRAREGRLIRSALSVLAFLSLTLSVDAAQLRAARVTQIMKDVRLLPGQAAPRAAVLNDDVNAGTAVRTGSDSRTELTFADLTITRLGADTIFSFNEGSREFTLNSGAMLVQVPRNEAEVKITTAAVTAAITGGTALLECNKGLPTKLLVMEGTGRFYPKGHPERAVIVRGGEMVMMTVDGHITSVTEFNAALVYKTAKLITSFPALANADLIMAVIQAQQWAQTGVASSPPAAGNELATTSQAVAAAGGPPVTTTTSSKFGSPSTITAPNPYHITSGTVIKTDPTITTNGKTDSGKIYRSLAQDGPFVPWIGLTESPFDIASNNPKPGDEASPLPVFLFAGLQFDGDPTVSTANGGVSHLGLASQGGITFGPGGATFQFSGIDRVGIVAFNGSINTAGAVFANFGGLFMEARGPGSSLTLSGPITLPQAHLVAEGVLQVNAPVTITDDSQEFKAFAGAGARVNSTVTAHFQRIESLGSFTVQSSAQLLSMLSATTGTTGQILIAASGDNGVSGVSGLVQADKGEVDLRATGLNGQVTVNNATLHGDVLKVAALGTNGALNIGGGNSLSADTVLKLYATGSNGTLNFLSSVTLSSPSNILAANTINIAQGAIVTINSPVMAEIYTNQPNYSGFGGIGTPATTGTFGGAGAKNPLPLSNAPPLGPPGGGP